MTRAERLVPDLEAIMRWYRKFWANDSNRGHAQYRALLAVLVEFRGLCRNCRRVLAARERRA